MAHTIHTRSSTESRSLPFCSLSVSVLFLSLSHSIDSHLYCALCSFVQFGYLYFFNLLTALFLPIYIICAAFFSWLLKIRFLFLFAFQIAAATTSVLNHPIA